MKLFLISQWQNNSYDTYDSAMVAAPDEDTARKMDPGTGEPIENWKDCMDTWCNEPELSQQYITLSMTLFSQHNTLLKGASSDQTRVTFDDQQLGLPAQFGDLRSWEISAIQACVNEAGFAIWVGGSAAKGTRRNLDRPDLKIGKGADCRSDIDYFTCESNLKIASSAALSRLPDQDGLPLIVDSNTEYSRGLQISLFSNPRILFSPGVTPKYES